MSTGTGAALLRVSFLLLLVVAAALAVLQVGWVNAASREEERRLRSSMTMGAQRVWRDAEDEIRILVSLARVTSADFARGDWAEITQGIRFWQDSSPFTALLLGAYILPSLRSEQGFCYDPEKREFAASTLPEEILAVSRFLLEPNESVQPGVAPGETMGYFLFPVATEGSISDELELPGAGIPDGAVALRLNRETLYVRLVPYLVSKHLEGMPFRVRSASPEAVLFEQGEIAPNARPEIVLDLEGLWLTDSRWIGALGRTGGAEASSSRSRSPLDDPSLRYWFLRVREERESARPQSRVEPRATGVSLEVFYPRGSIEETVGLRRALNIVVGAGLVATLVLSAFVLYRLYHRSARLRESEQQFVASMSHELRTPITVIQATSENLRRGVVSEPSRVSRYGGVINEQARRLAGMVESVLYYSGLESGGARRLAAESVDLAALVEETVLPLKGVAEERGKSLHVSVEARAPIRSESAALRLIIENLVMNALNHARPGEVRLSVSHSKPASLVINVEDQGPGIPLREQSRIFEPFVRSARSRREQEPGSGLGLHLVKRVATMLGGSVRLESPYLDRSGARVAGCRFEVRILAEEAGAESPRVESPRVESPRVEAPTPGTQVEGGQAGGAAEVREAGPNG